MNSKEKAEELVRKFIEPTMSFSNEMGWQEDKSSAKIASIICVDQILKLPSIQDGRMIAVVSFDYEYWENVKKEINLC